MTGDARSILADFLAVELARAGETACIKIELVYHPPDGFSREELRAWRLDDPNDADAFKPHSIYRDKLITTMLEHAEQRAETSGGTDRKIFRVVIHQAGGERMTRVFPILSAYAGQDGVERPLVASTTGVVDQVMRQNHDLHKINVKLMASIATLVQAMGKNQVEIQDRMARQHEKRDQRILELEDQRTKALALIEEAKTLEHERAIEAKVVEAVEQRKAKALDTFETIGKAIAGHYGIALPGGSNGTPTQPPGSVKPGAAKPGEDVAAMLTEFLATLSADQKRELLTHLPMDLKIALGELQKLAGGADTAKLYDFLVYFFKQLQGNETTVDLLDEILTGKQKRLFDRIYDRVTEHVSARPNPPPATEPVVEVAS